MLGEVIADLTSRRGKIFGMEPTSKGNASFHAQAPHAELRTYAPELRSLTKGMGYFTMEITGYEEVPHPRGRRRCLRSARAEQGKDEPKAEPSPARGPRLRSGPIRETAHLPVPVFTDAPMSETDEHVRRGAGGPAAKSVAVSGGKRGAATLRSAGRRSTRRPRRRYLNYAPVP